MLHVGVACGCLGCSQEGAGISMCVSPSWTINLVGPSFQPHLPPITLQIPDFSRLDTKFYTLDLPVANMKSFTAVVALLSW